MTAGVSVPTRYGRLPDETPDSHWQWDAPTVGEWLGRLGLAAYSQNFVTHQVTGDLLERMDKDDLRDLGVGLVGHRLLLLREVATLRRKAETKERSKMLWQSQEVVHRDGPLGWLRHHLACRPCLRGPDSYTLTGRAVVIVSHEDRHLLSCSAPSSTTRSIELGNIAGVTHQHRSAPFDCCCGCAADDVVIELNREVGLPPVAPLSVRRGTGWQVAQLIESAVEEAEAFHSKVAGDLGGMSPLPQAMARSASRDNLGA